MTLDQSKYLGAVANRIGIINWTGCQYTPKDSLERIQAFSFEGTGNLPRFKEKVGKELMSLFTVIIEDNTVYLY